MWHVEFSPLNFYFATASYDHTARLWSTDQIYTKRVFAGHLSDVNVCFVLRSIKGGRETRDRDRDKDRDTDRDRGCFC